jgi:TonB family protein
MKKISQITVICLFLAFSINAQTNDANEQTKALTEINNLNGQVIALYRQEKYDEALKTALGVLNLVDKNNLSKDLRVLPALSNLGEIYLAKGKESEAIAIFQKVLEGYQANSGDQKLPIAKITERIAVAYYYKKDYGKAEELFLKLLPLRETLNGAESRETAKINTALGDVYRGKDQNAKADGFYRRAIEINDKVLTKEEKEQREDIGGYECFLYHKALRENKVKEVPALIKAFKDSRKSADSENNTIDSGIVNGKAIDLVKPPYPTNARGFSGFVLVQVTIDEQGNVISAKATCGILEFVKAVEEAARRSKFSPTSVNGQAVKVTGVIVYNFVR